MYGVLDEAITKLHVAADGCVWFCRGAEAAENSECKIDDFLRQPIVSGFGNIFRLLGVARNAELIASLYVRRKDREVRAVQVAGPNTLLSPDEVNDPELAILRMRSLSSSPAAGGWHNVDMADYPTYALIARMARNNADFDTAAATYLRLHPAYKALSFIPTICPTAVANVLVRIIDPRWFVFPGQKNASSKLLLFLGLSPKVQRRVSKSGMLLTALRDVRCTYVLSSWKTVDPAEVDMKNPANFLYRIWQAAGGGWRGDLRASQAFVRYLRDNWLAGLDPRVGVSDGLFAPDLYFKMPAEIAHYREHMSTKV